ncbi:MAG: TIGR00730 family Rossman fold protein [Rhodobacteraceae bacterium]|nr:TIGR00730 family Rossman fold protein [Paracoccaceae bacterium]
MRLCVFCGSRPGTDPDYAAAAVEMGRLLARRGVGLVYGGGRVGLMGVVADAAMSAGGEVIGVIPRALAEREIEHRGLTENHIVETMHERKALMAELSDGFVALPGGAGTLEEIFEQWTWVQLGIHDKPCGFLNVKGYYDPLKAMVDLMTKQGFLQPEHAALSTFSDRVEDILAAFAAFSPPDRIWRSQSERPRP